MRVSPDSRTAARVCLECSGGEFQDVSGHQLLACRLKIAVCGEGKHLVPGKDVEKDVDDVTCAGCGDDEYKAGTTNDTACARQVRTGMNNHVHTHARAHTHTHTRARAHAPLLPHLPLPVPLPPNRRNVALVRFCARPGCGQHTVQSGFAATAKGF